MAEIVIVEGYHGLIVVKHTASDCGIVPSVPCEL